MRAWTRGSGNFSRREQNEDIHILFNVMEAVIDLASNIKKRAGPDLGGFSVHGEFPFAFDDVINLILPMRCLRILFAFLQAVKARTQCRHTQELTVFNRIFARVGETGGDVFEMTLHSLETASAPQ